MENIKDLKLKLEELKKQNKIIVGVEQNRDDEMETTNKMYLKNVWEDEKTNIIHLLGFLYQKTILKSNSIKIKYNYNYSDKQDIKIIYTYINYDNTTTKTIYTFYNIPTNLAYLDTFKLEKVVNNER